jgi:hypothetical protein
LAVGNLKYLVKKSPFPSIWIFSMYGAWSMDIWWLIPSSPAVTHII